MIKNNFSMYAVSDMSQARKFYEEDLNLTISSDLVDRWVEYNLPQHGRFIITTLAENVLPSADCGGMIGFEVDGFNLLHSPYSLNLPYSQKFKLF